VCVISSLDNSLTIYRLKDIKPPLDKFDELAVKIYGGLARPGSARTSKDLAAVLRKLHTEENLFQVIGVARDS
jgi:hypothetical protein